MKIIYAAPVNQSYSSISSKAQSDDLYKYFGDYEFYDDLQILWIYKITATSINNKACVVTPWDQAHNIRNITRSWGGRIWTVRLKKRKGHEGSWVWAIAGSVRLQSVS